MLPESSSGSLLLLLPPDSRRGLLEQLPLPCRRWLRRGSLGPRQAGSLCRGWAECWSQSPPWHLWSGHHFLPFSPRLCCTSLSVGSWSRAPCPFGGPSCSVPACVPLTRLPRHHRRDLFSPSSINRRLGADRHQPVFARSSVRNYCVTREEGAVKRLIREENLHPP